MMPTRLEWIKHDWVWKAIGGVVGIAAFLVALLTFLRGTRLRYSRLQRILDKERSFYAAMPSPRSTIDEDLVQRTAQTYFSSVNRGISGIERLPPDATRVAREKLRVLLLNLRTTHQTLVTVLEPFSTGDAKKFFEEFDSFNSKFTVLYHGGQIAHDARTHCSDIEQVLGELGSQIQFSTPGWSDVDSLRGSVVVYDKEVIVPIMTEILERTQTELAIIAQAIRDGDRRKALVLKEKFWFDVRDLYHDVSGSLTRMTDLARAL
jgi:hypothetical protein